MFEHVPRQLVLGFVSLAFAAVTSSNCQGATPAAGSENPPRVHAPAPADVIRIATGELPDAKQTLLTIANTNDRADVRMLAKAILSLWNDQENTYTSPEARYLPYASADPPPAVFAVAEVSVAEDGRPLTVAVLKNDRPELTPEIESFLMKRIYLPARVDGRYVASKAAALLRRETR
jgi:hypothetical protein